MLHTTFALAKKSHACILSYRKFAEFKGGVKKWGKDTPFPLSEVLEICGLDDALWTLRCTIEPSENLSIEFACQCAEHVLHLFEHKYLDDKRPRKAIEAARVCITDKSEVAVRAAEEALWAAGVAARAAWAEIAWQKQTLLKLLDKVGA